MTLRLWPKDFERKEHITKEEKYLLRSAAQNIKSGHFAVGIDPIGMSTDKIHMGLFIDPEGGLLSFSVYTESVDIEQVEIYKTYVEMVEQRIHQRLLDSKVLIARDGDNKFLKFPYRHVIIFANERPSSIKKSPLLKELYAYAYVGFLFPLKKKKREFKFVKPSIAENCRITYDTCFNNISEKECKAIFERLAPEYTVVIHEREQVEVKETKAITKEQDFLITGKELEYKTFFLDEYQVSLVNDMGRGHRVLLANPGAGKSVILLSKAFKYASLYKDSKVLLTCFNNNLSDSYAFKRSCANFGNNRNLYIMTLHKLVKKLFEECLNKRCYSNIATPEEIQECLDKVRSNEIRVRFKAIFIDEVQIFEPLYLELCYALLEKSDDAIFLMAGDLNQTVRSQSRRGDAPWKRINGVSLDFTGRVKYIEKNYRNSQQIGDYLNRMLHYMNMCMDKYNMISIKEFEYDSFTPGEYSGIALKVKTGVERRNIQTAVLDCIKEVVNKYKLGYSDIAVLFPVKKNVSMEYYFMYWLTAALEKEGIPYSLITPSDNESQKKVKYSQTTGIVISTIDSSLGLDFKAVIVAGLFPYNYVFSKDKKKIHINTWEEVGLLDQNQQEQIQIQMRKIYTACSRARDILYIVSDLQSESPMELLLTEPLKENNKDVK